MVDLGRTESVCRSGCSRKTETVYFFTLLQDAGWLPALLDHHNNDDRRRKPDGTEIEGIKKCEGVRNERIQVQTDTDDHAEGSVAEGTWIRYRRICFCQL